MPHLHRLAGFLVLCALVAGLLAPGEEGDGAERKARAATPAERPQTVPPSPVKPKPSTALPSHPLQPAAQIARRVKANEIGKVPVLMYHRVVAKQRTYLDRTPGEVRAEFTRLAKEGYVPVTAAEYVTGRIPVPAGRSPVVLTFDDSDSSQLNFDSRGAPRPDTAVGILLEIARKYPGFRPVATMYVNKDPFMLGSRAADALRWLVQHGFEVGNHTYEHRDLSGLSSGSVREEIGGIERVIQTATRRPAVTLAYPFGEAPRRLSWAVSGTSSGARWRFSGMFLAGWSPGESPYDEDYDPMEIPRIRSEAKISSDDCKRHCSSAWLDWLRKHPWERYVSDGDPSAISLPSRGASELDGRYRGRARVY